MNYCKNCRWWEEVRHMCHRHPPRVFMLNEGHERSIWPSVYSLDWCGEFQATEQNEQEVTK